MAVSKPSWLSRALDLLNWDIFTWKVYIGDAIERAIDWALGWVNWGIDQAKLAYNKAVDAWNKAVDFARILTATIYREAGYLWNRVNQWASDLAEWWEGKKTTVLGWIDATKSWAKERIDDARAIINRLDIAWDNFRRDTLPRLASKLDVRDLIVAAFAPWASLFNMLETFKTDIAKFFGDPEKWLLDRIESMLARFW